MFSSVVDKKDFTPDELKILVRDRVKSANDNVAIFSHDRLTERNLDHVADPLHFVERLVADGLIKKQSELVAHKIEAAGGSAYVSGNDRVSMVGLVSGAVINLSGYLNRNIIPEVAQRKRRPMVAEFELFMKERPEISQYARYMVVTSGKRFPIEELSTRLDLLNEQLEDYFALCREQNVEPLLVALEFTVDEDDTLNLHANLVTWPKRAFGAAGWTAWLKTTRVHFGDLRKGDEWTFNRDAGIIRDANEIIKYVCKYGDIASLDAEKTRAISDALHRRQLVRPLGVFKDWRRKLKDAGQKVRFDHQSKQLVRCQVAQRKRTGDQEWTEEETWDEITGELKAIRKEEAVRSGKSRAEDPDRPRDPIENQILCRTLPQTRATLMAEPFVVVVNFRPDPKTQNGKDGLKAINRRRKHHFKLLAEEGIESSDMATAGGSILDTQTLIPSQVSKAYPSLTPSRRKKIDKLLSIGPLEPGEDLREVVEEAVREVLERHHRFEVHEWCPDVADVAALLREGAAAQEAWTDFASEAREAADRFDASGPRHRAGPLGEGAMFAFDALDDLIPW